jgi:hypothetical protein
LTKEPRGRQQALLTHCWPDAQQVGLLLQLQRTWPEPEQQIALEPLPQTSALGQQVDPPVQVWPEAQHWLPHAYPEGQHTPGEPTQVLPLPELQQSEFCVQPELLSPMHLTPMLKHPAKPGQ